MVKTEPKASVNKHNTQKNKGSFFREGGDLFAERQPEIQPFFNANATKNNGNDSGYFFNKPTIQPKLTIGQPGDKYEQEANAMADKVVQKMENQSSLQTSPKANDNSQLISQPFSISRIQRKPFFENNQFKNGPYLQKKGNTILAPNHIQKQENQETENLSDREDNVPEEEKNVQRKPAFEGRVPPEDNTKIQRKCEDCEKKENIQPKSNNNTNATPDLESRLNSSRGGGSPLPGDTRSNMENAFGADFSGVRVHTGSDSIQMNRNLNAQAFTHGSDIYFNQGNYNSNSKSGRHLLAHELTHTLQQSKSTNIQRQIHTQDFQDEPHIVTGHVSERRRRELEDQRRGRQRTAIGSWASHMAGRQESISDMVVHYRQSLIQMEGYKNTLIEGYGIARNRVDQKIEEANASRSTRAAILNFVLGLLPGLKSAALSLRATDFISDMSILNSAIEGIQSGALDSAYSRATEPISSIQEQLLGTQQLSGQTAETTDHFALRLNETLRHFTLSILDLSMVANHMGRHSLYTQVDQIQQKVSSGTSLSPAEQRVAQAIQNAESNWPNFNRAMSQLLSAMNRAESRLFLTSESWPLGNRFEKMLWIVYLSTLSEDQSEVIDQDEIEERLTHLQIIGNPSILALDFGSVTWLRDTIMAVRRAQNFRPQILTALNTFNLETANYVLTPRSAEII